jgi:hypothetical protein
MTKLIICFLILVGSFCIQGHASSPLARQDVVMDQDSVHIKFVRGGVGMAASLGYFGFGEVNRYISDIYSAIKNSQLAFQSSNPKGEIHFGYGYKGFAEVRIAELYQAEAFYSQFFSFPFHLTIAAAGGWSHKTETFSFESGLQETGGLFLITPALKNKKFRVLLGAGAGYIKGNIHQWVSGYTSIANPYPFLNKETTYYGSSIAYSGVIGISVTPWRFLDADLRIKGKYAMIPEVKNDQGEVFINRFNNNDPVSLNFSGVEISLAIRFLFP